MNTFFIAISTILALISPLIYSKAILKGDAKPHRTTRLVLLIITSLATASLFAQNDRVAIWLAAASTLQALVIFILSIRYGMGGWAKSDILCLVIALIGIIAWQTTNEPLIGLYSSMAADLAGMFPALIKTYYQPNTEIVSFFLLDVFAGFFSMLAVKSWTIQEFSYPIYIMVINFLMVLIIIRPKPNKR